MTSVICISSDLPAYWARVVKKVKMTATMVPSKLRQLLRAVPKKQARAACSHLRVATILAFLIPTGTPVIEPLTPTDNKERNLTNSMNPELCEKEAVDGAPQSDTDVQHTLKKSGGFHCRIAVAILAFLTAPLQS